MSHWKLAEFFSYLIFISVDVYFISSDENVFIIIIYYNLFCSFNYNNLG